MVIPWLSNQDLTPMLLMNVSLVFQSYFNPNIMCFASDGLLLEEHSKAQWTIPTLEFNSSQHQQI